ncbi:MAG TPA: hypothetical protein VGN96_14625 [Roseococcus sp.]|jgi:hypothetical protein|nr:hypothetical protein [Roseococcus sp.]
MVKTSMIIMVVLTVLISILLGWREQRLAQGRPAPRPGWVARQKARANRYVTAAALAAIATMLTLGGLHWLRVLQG